MTKLKWWQWTIVALVTISAVGTAIDVITGNNSAGNANSVGSSSNPTFKLISGDNVFAITFNQDIDPDALPDIARDHCGARDFCEVLGWTDSKYTARGFPLTKREAVNLKFQYTLTRINRAENIFWDCNIWKRADEQSCIIRE